MSQTTKWVVKFKVRPSTEHPLFYEIQYGVLTVITPGKESAEASARARAIVNALPFEVIHTHTVPVEFNQDDFWEGDDYSGNFFKMLGVHLFLMAAKTGCGDEEWFMNLGKI